MTLGSIAAAAPAPGTGASATDPAATAEPNRVIGTEVTPIMPPGYTETTTTTADGVITMVITNAAGSVVETAITTATMPEPGVTGSGTSMSLWA